MARMIWRLPRLRHPRSSLPVVLALAASPLLLCGQDAALAHDLDAGAASADFAGLAVRSIIRLENVPEIDSVIVGSSFDGHQSGVDRDLTGGEPAYDYGVHIFWDTEWRMYRMYTGGRWLRPGIPHADGDHVLQHVSRTGRGGTWFSRGAPEFWHGSEEGLLGTWWSNNCLEPEVVRAGGIYTMFWQVQIGPGQTLDTGEKAVAGADRIGLSTSHDGMHWERGTERGVVVNVDRPASTALTHEEVVYVPDDPDGKPWWLYVHVVADGRSQGHVRMRSDDPSTFDWRDRQPCHLPHLGNQIAYANGTPAGRLFVRITHAQHPATGRDVPCLQFSMDGLSWSFGDGGPAMLDGSRDTAKNPNCYFLGISTIDGTGELQRVGTNTYRAVYGATTAVSPVAPEIFDAEIGVGQVVIRILGRAQDENLEPGPDSESEP